MWSEKCVSCSTHQMGSRVYAALCCRDGCTHVLALCSRPYTTGPAWGKYLTRALHNAIKYWLLNPVSVPHS